ncbi:MAG TPA: hypothetical protein VM032_13995 [Vicinamibacterales bacterium]|nr:hypothetical protein [Vicinamibacterales bacterium]
MRLLFLLVAAIALAAPAGAQEPRSSPAGSDRSPGPDASDLPVSLGRIREQLKKPASSRLKNLDVKPDFSVQVEEQRRIDAILSKIDFTSGPAPAGGVYGFEQQRRLFNPTDRPLQQPYAAFSGGELITLAIESLIGRYLGGRVLNAVSAAERSRAEALARREVDQAVAEYCAGRADRLEIHLCNRN